MLESQAPISLKLSPKSMGVWSVNAFGAIKVTLLSVVLKLKFDNDRSASIIDVVNISSWAESKAGSILWVIEFSNVTCTFVGTPISEKSVPFPSNTKLP